MTASGIAASTKWRSKTLDVSTSALSVSGEAVPSSASSVASMRTTQTMPMTVKQLASMPLGSSASITSRTSITSHGPSLSTASAKWRSKWPSAPTSTKTTNAKEPNQAPTPAPAKATAAVARAAAGGLAATVEGAQETASADVTSATGEPNSATLEQASTEQTLAPQSTVPRTEILAPKAIPPEQPIESQSLPEAEPVGAESNESPATGAVLPATEPGCELPAEAAAPTPMVAQATEQPAAPVSQEVAAQTEQVEPEQLAESEQPVPVVSTAPPAEPSESSAAAVPDVPAVPAEEEPEAPTQATAASTASVAAEPAPEPTPTTAPGATAVLVPAQNSAEGPEPAKPQVTAVEAPQTPEAAKPMMHESAPAPASVATAKVEDGVTMTAGEAAAVAGKTDGLKVALLNFGEVGAPLADKSEIDQVFKWRNLEPLWVDKPDNFPRDAVVLVTTGTQVGSELLAKAPDLKLVAVASDGFDPVDVDECKARGIAVVNVPGCSTDAAAELAIAFVLAHLRNLAACQKTLAEGFWTCPSQHKLSSKTVGVLGVGSLGLRLAEIFHAFGVKSLLGYSPAQTVAFTELGGTYLESLEELFRRSDVVCICCSFSSETQGLVSEALLELLRPSSVLVNVAHGGVIDEDALGRLLANGRFRAGLDVFQTEPLPANSSLRSMPAETLLATPHVGYQTVECLEKRFDTTIKNILAFQLDQAINRVA